jgi:hypothetical protein
MFTNIRSNPSWRALQWQKNSDRRFSNCLRDDSPVLGGSGKAPVLRSRNRQAPFTCRVESVISEMPWIDSPYRSMKT